MPTGLFQRNLWWVGGLLHSLTFGPCTNSKTKKGCLCKNRLCIYLSFHSVTCQFYLTVISVLPVYPTLRGIVRFYPLTWFGFLITLSTLRIAMRRRFVKQSWVLPHSTETTFDVKSCIGSCILWCQFFIVFSILLIWCSQSFYIILLPCRMAELLSTHPLPPFVASFMKPSLAISLVGVLSPLLIPQPNGYAFLLRN